MIEIRNLNYYINTKPILENINLDIPFGEFASIIGPNGAGKSTLAKIILRLITGYTGTIRIENRPHKEWLKEHIIGYVPQKEQYDREFPATVMDIVLMGIAGKKGLLNFFNRKDKKEACAIMEKVGILRFKDQYIGALSGGEFQRVMLARALMSGARFLILDEPEAGVDKDGVVNYYKLLKDLNLTGKTILMISHDISNTSKFCSMLICLNRTLHCHTKPELVNSEIIERTFGKAVQIIERK